MTMKITELWRIDAELKDLKIKLNNTSSSNTTYYNFMVKNGEKTNNFRKKGFYVRFVKNEFGIIPIEKQTVK